MISDNVSDGSNPDVLAGEPDEDSEYRSRWLRTSTLLLLLAYLGALACIGVVISQLVDSSEEHYVVAWTVGGLFVAISIPLSLHAIYLHLTNYHSNLQRHCIRVLWLVPFYSIQSWLALRFTAQTIYLEAFMRFCVTPSVMWRNGGWSGYSDWGAPMLVICACFGFALQICCPNGVSADLSSGIPSTAFISMHPAEYALASPAASFS